MIWNKEIECMNAADMRVMQSERLIMLVKNVYENVPFYKRKWTT